MDDGCCWLAGQRVLQRIIVENSTRSKKLVQTHDSEITRMTVMVIVSV